MSSEIIAIGAIVVGAIVLFWIVSKLLRWLFTMIVVGTIAAIAVWYCVHAGYIGEETAEKLNPMNNDKLVETMHKAGGWAGEKIKDTIKGAAREALKEGLKEDGE